MKTRVEVTTNEATGESEVRQFDVPAEQRERLDAMLPETAAQQLLAKLRARHIEPIEKIEAEGQFFIIRRLGWHSLNKINLLTSRNAEGEPVDLDSSEFVKSRIAAMIHVAVVDDDGYPFFSLADANSMMDDWASVYLVSELANNINRLNPSIFPKAAAPKSPPKNSPGRKTKRRGGKETLTTAAQPT